MKFKFANHGKSKTGIPFSRYEVITNYEDPRMSDYRIKKALRAFVEKKYRASILGNVTRIYQYPGFECFLDNGRRIVFTEMSVLTVK